MRLRLNQLMESGERVSNAWVTCLMERDSPGKLGIKPYRYIDRMIDVRKLRCHEMDPRPIS